MSESGLPPGWEVRHSNTKDQPYYFNSETKESQWKPPTGTETDKLKSYMSQYLGSTGGESLGSTGTTGNSEGKIRAAHLLVKHSGSRRPASWREAEITRSKEESMEIIRSHEARIKNGETLLGELATTESDCSSAKKRGDLGFFGHGDMQKEFEDVAFALKPGEMSGVVDTPSGLHLIERLE